MNNLPNLVVYILMFYFDIDDKISILLYKFGEKSMEHLLSYMENAIILSTEDIVRFKAYITKKYADLPRKEHAHVLANAINRVVDNNLDGIDLTFRKELKQRLFQHTLALQHYQISKRDVFEEIVVIDTNPEAICTYAMTWMEKNISEIASEFNLEDLKNYVQKVQSPELELSISPNLQPETIHSEIVQPETVQPETVQMTIIQSNIVQSESSQPEKLQPQLQDKEVVVHTEIKPVDSNFYDLQDFQRIVLMILLDVSEKLIPSKNLQKKIANYGLWLVMLFTIHTTFQMLPPWKLYELVHNEAPVAIESTISTTQPLIIEMEKNQMMNPIIDLKHCISLIPPTAKSTTIQETRNVISLTQLLELKLEKKEATVEKKANASSLTSNTDMPLENISFDITALQTYLSEQNSMLAKSPYFETIVDTATSHDIDPRLLFAIAGQEQSLVKQTHKNASKIANNPFNVYGSWQKYNTNIADSSQVVCNTIVKRLSTKPNDADPLIWLNKTYAEDQNWHKGVRKYYNTLRLKTNFN